MHSASGDGSAKEPPRLADKSRRTGTGFTECETLGFTVKSRSEENSVSLDETRFMENDGPKESTTSAEKGRFMGTDRPLQMVEPAENGRSARKINLGNATRCNTVAPTCSMIADAVATRMRLQRQAELAKDNPAGTGKRQAKLTKGSAGNGIVAATGVRLTKATHTERKKSPGQRRCIPGDKPMFTSVVNDAWKSKAIWADRKTTQATCPKIRIYQNPQVQAASPKIRISQNPVVRAASPKIRISPNPKVRAISAKLRVSQQPGVQTTSVKKRKSQKSEIQVTFAKKQKSQQPELQATSGRKSQKSKAQPKIASPRLSPQPKLQAASARKSLKSKLQPMFATLRRSQKPMICDESWAPQPAVEMILINMIMLRTTSGEAFRLRTAAETYFTLLANETGEDAEVLTSSIKAAVETRGSVVRLANNKLVIEQRFVVRPHRLIEFDERIRCAYANVQG